MDQEQVFDHTNFDADLFALELLDVLEVGFADNDVIAVRVVGEHDHYAFAAAGTGRKRVTVRHQIGVDLARAECIHRGRIVEPLKIHIDSGFLKPAFVDGDLPRDPSGPVAVTDRQRRRQNWRARYQENYAEDCPNGTFATHRTSPGLRFTSKAACLVRREDKTVLKEVVRGRCKRSSPRLLTTADWRNDLSAAKPRPLEVSRAFVPPCTRT